MNVSWLVNGTVVKDTEKGVIEASYTNISAAVGMWDITAIASNENGTVMQTWIWNVSQQATLTSTSTPTPSLTPSPSPPITPTPTPSPAPIPALTQSLESNITPSTLFYIYGWVHYENEVECNNPSVNITNQNTSKEWPAKTRPGYNYYQIVLANGTEINASERLQFNVTDGVGYNTTTRTVTQSDINKGVIFDFNLTLPTLALTVGVELAPDDDPETEGVQVINPDYLTKNRTVTITANVTDVNGYENITSAIAIITGPGNVTDSPVSLVFVSNSSLTTAIYNGTFNMSNHPEGEYKVEVNATNTDGFTGTGSMNFTYSYGPDLTVTTISTPFYLIPNVSNTINAIIENIGAAPAAGFNVSLTVNDTLNDTFIDIKTVSSLNASHNKSISFSWTPNREGNYTLTVMADSNHAVSESNETNNNYTRTPDVLVGVPDFAVTRPILNSTHPLDGDIVNITVSILNNGIREGNCTVEFWDVKSEGNEALLKNQTISLLPDGNKSLTANWTATTGNHTILVRAINSSLVPDGNMENNENETRIYVNAFDFIIPTLEPSTSNPLLGENVTINATIENIGDKSRNVTVMVGFYLDNNSTPFEIKQVLLNTSGKNYTTMVWNANVAGEHNITAEVDPDDNITEFSESNNNQTIQISVNGTDLAVTNIDIPCNIFNPCYVGHEIPINVTIENFGAIDATNFTVFFVDGLGEGNKSGVNTTFFNISIPLLNSSENRSIPVTWTPKKFGWHTITVNILPFDNNTENNETNNEMYKNVGVKSSYEFSVEDVLVYPDEVKEGDDVTIIATIKNLGKVKGSVNVSFFVNSTDFVGSWDERFIEIERTEKPVYVEVNKTNSTLISWRVNVTGGDHLIYAVVNPDNELIEWPQSIHKLGNSIILKNQTLAGNNVRSCSLQVIEPDLKIKPPLTVEPSKPVEGDPVNVTAAIINEGVENVTSTVWFYMENEISKDIQENEPNVGHTVKKNRSLFLLLLPENVSIRAHFRDMSFHDVMIPWVNHTHKNLGMDEVINASVDGKPVDFYVKCKYVADGQPIRVSPIDYNTYCYRSKSNGREWTDVWTEWGYGKKFELTALTNGPYHIEAYIDKYQIRLGNRTVTLDAGDTGTYNVTWNTSSMNASYYTLMANLEDDVVTNKTFLRAPDIAVTNLSVEKEVLDGNQGWINATITNVCMKDETNITVKLTVIYEPEKPPSEICSYDKPLPEYSEEFEIKPPPVNNESSFNRSWNASIKGIEFKNAWCCEICDNFRCYDCPWSEIAENYTVKVEIISFDQNETKVHVKRSRDFSITDLVINGTSAAAPHDRVNLTLDDEVTMNATLNITNLAKSGGTMNVSFYIDEVDVEHEIGNLSTNFTSAINETKSVKLENWTVRNRNIDDVVNIAGNQGNHSVIVVVDPENKIHEINESNNTYIQKIHVRAPELTVTNLTFEPDKDKINESESINITVEVANYGEKDAKNVSLVVYDYADGHIDTDVRRVYGSNVYPDKADKVLIEKENATAMKLYLDLDIDGGEVCIRDSKGNKIIDPPYRENFHGWTPWIDSNVTIEAIRSSENSSVFAKVSKIYYLERSNPPINTTTIPELRINEPPVNLTFEKNWTDSQAGERFIVAIIDPKDKDNITEYNELNNTFARYITVQTADLAVEDIKLLRWLNGTWTEENDIRDNDTVRIVANITNIGVNETENFSVRILVDDVVLLNETKSTTLMPGDLTNASANWTAEVGTHVLKVEADYNNEINETNETNNIEAKEIYVQGAEVSGNTSWKSSGLHGLNGTILFDPAQPYDEDDVNITAVINNSGEVNATDFGVALFFDYEPPDVKHKFSDEGEKNWDLNYENATCIYLYLYINTTVEYQVLAIYDGNDTEIARTDRSCWVRVHGDRAKIREIVSSSIWSRRFIAYSIYVYPVYADNLTRIDKLTVNSSKIVPLMTVRNVTAGTHTVFLFIDPEGKVPEDVDNKSDNIVSRVMEVVPTRDFTIVEVIPENANISDADTLNIIANVTNVGLKKIIANLSWVGYGNETAKVYRNGTTKVRFVDYENETRIHKYYLNNSLPEFSHMGRSKWERIPVKFLHLSNNLSYLPVSPGETFSSQYENLTIIHRPGVDAIKLNFDSITLHSGLNFPYPGEIHVFNGTGMEVLSANIYREIWVFNGTGMEYHKLEQTDSLLPVLILNKNVCPGDTAYIYTVCADFNLSGYTTKKIFNETANITLNASVAWNESGNITSVWCESKNITPMWTASTGDHNITVTIDPYNETSEMNETNNTYVLPLSVNASKDIEIIELNITPLHPTDGKNVNITAVVQNKGNKTVNSSVDLWMDTVKDSSSALVPYNWSISQEGEKTRYITLLNHTEPELSLAPGETFEVNATWENISVYGNPTYVVRAIVDPLDAIDEMNESNNEMNTEIIMNYPDFTVTGFNAPTRNNNNTASVTIKNIGAANASNVTVLLELTRHKYEEHTGIADIENETTLNITEPGASRIRVHFAEIVVTIENSHLDIYGWDNETGEYRVAQYSHSVEGRNLWKDVWSPWVEGDMIIIDYCGAGFDIYEKEWGDVYNTTINLNASESVNVSLPKSPRNWNKYEGLAFLNATVDPDDEKMEQWEDNNNRNTTIYVDLVLKEIKIEENKIKPIIWSNDTVENGIAFPVRNFSISLQKKYNSSYKTIQTKWFNETIYGGEVKDVSFDIYECLNKHYFEVNNKSNIKVKVDSEDEIEELNEDNNEKEMEIGPDIDVESINVWPTYPVVDRHTGRINVILRNNGCLPAEGFVVNCSLNIKYLNASGGIESDNINLPSETFSLDLNGTRNGTGILTFEWEPPDNYAAHLPYYDVSKIKIVADTNDIVNELDETNNEKTRDSAWRIYTETGYDANHPLETYAHNTEPINCGVNYTIGDSYYMGGGDPLSVSSDYGPVHFNDIIPEGATVRLARLYLYWTWGYVKVDDPLGGTKKTPAPLVVEVTFNGHTFYSVPADGNYTDLPTATVEDVAWGTYAYDVRGFIGRNNTVNATRREPMVGNDVTMINVPAIAGMGLLVIYERDDLPLTTYWINEGADVLWRSMMTGLTPEDCTTDAPFNGPADRDRVNATLWTVVPFGDGGDDRNRLFFNDEGEWHGVWHGSIYWPPGMDNRYVTNYLISQDNRAGLQEIDDCMMPSNAFLILTYPPDLEPSLEKVPPLVVGNSYEIPVVIYNKGKSDARNFSVSFYADGGYPRESKQRVHEVVEGDGGSTTRYFSWTAPSTPRIVEFKVVVDSDKDVEELINKQHPYGELNNNATKLVSVGLGELIPPLHPGGRGGGTGGGWGTGTGTGEGSGEGEGTGTGGAGGEGAIGERGGEAITGWLMKGTVASSEEGGGGGKGEFSLVAWLIRLAMLAAAVALVCAGYLLERRRQKYKQ